VEEKLDKLVIELAEIEKELSKPEVISDLEKYKDLSRKHSRLTKIVNKYNQYKKIKEEISQSGELVKNETDPDMEALILEELETLQVSEKKILHELKILLLPKDPNSGKDIILEIRAGTGGEEAALFVSDLLKMYLRYAEEKGLKTELISSDHTGIGGYKEVILSIRGEDAYELFIGEAGGHRVQRIPETESGGRIHTSAATVAVLPEAEEKEIVINDADLRIDFYRSSGPGGQSVNTTDSAVRLTHINTGIVVTCQDEKSQLKNKEKAMRILRARVYEKEIRKQKAQADFQKKTMIGSGDRSQRIRTYNYPQNRLTDHQINYSSFNLEDILSGNLDDLILKKIQFRQNLLLQL
jgi:peptide chain release factor 1